jgi:hypothetical protein
VSKAESVFATASSNAEKTLPPDGAAQTPSLPTESNDAERTQSEEMALSSQTAAETRSLFIASNDATRAKSEAKKLPTPIATPPPILSTVSNSTEQTQAAVESEATQKLPVSKVSTQEFLLNQSSPPSSPSAEKSSRDLELQFDCMHRVQEATPSRISLRRSPRRLSTKPKQAPSPLVTSTSSSRKKSTASVEGEPAVKSQLKSTSNESDINATTLPPTQVEIEHLQKASKQAPSLTISKDTLLKREYMAKPSSNPAPVVSGMRKNRNTLTISTAMATDTPPVPHRNPGHKSMSASPACPVNEKSTNRTTPLASRDNCVEVQPSRGAMLVPSGSFAIHHAVEKAKQANFKVEADMITLYASRIFSNSDIRKEVRRKINKGRTHRHLFSLLLCFDCLCRHACQQDYLRCLRCRI